MGFIEYKRGRVKAGYEKPVITILRAKVLNISRVAEREFFEGYDFARLFWDPDRRVIGILPVKEEGLNTVRVRRIGTQLTQISVIAFMSRFGLSCPESTAYDVAKNEDGIIEIPFGGGGKKKK